MCRPRLAGLKPLSRAMMLALGLAAGWVSVPEMVWAQEPAARSAVDASAAVHVPAVTVPFSSLASEPAKAAFLKEQQRQRESAGQAPAASIAETRARVVARLQPVLDRTRKRYPVEIEATKLAGVPVQVITPRGGVARRNQHRVLINLHGGGFSVGAGIVGALESVPVASLLAIKVVTVDYRQGPEHKFPAASEDVAAVYQALLKTVGPQGIGIYGCSAGGVLTAQAVAWIDREKLPRPGAIGMLCGSAAGWIGGDSATVGLLLSATEPEPGELGPPLPELSNVAYFNGARPDDPLVLPIRSGALLARFPPTLIVSSTRDFALSPAVYTHTQLVKHGVDAELHVWDGLTHAFFVEDPDLPESAEVWNVLSRFFDRHLRAAAR